MDPSGSTQNTCNTNLQRDLVLLRTNYMNIECHWLLILFLVIIVFFILRLIGDLLDLRSLLRIISHVLYYWKKSVHEWRVTRQYKLKQ